MANVTLADAMLVAAESVVKMAKQSGLTINLVDVYQKDHKQLALIAGFIKEYAGTVADNKIEVIRS
jgi:hypothetical protein